MYSETYSCILCFAIEIHCALCILDSWCILYAYLECLPTCLNKPVPSHPALISPCCCVREQHSSPTLVTSRACYRFSHLCAQKRPHQPGIAQAKGTPGGRALWALTFYNPNLGLPTRERRPVERLLVGALSNILVFLGEEREWKRVDREGENEPR